MAKSIIPEHVNKRRVYQNQLLHCSTEFTTGFELKEKLELWIAMLEQANNKIFKTHDHCTANRIIDSHLSGLCIAVFQNIAGKNELAAELQTFKVARDQGEILELVQRAFETCTTALQLRVEARGVKLQAQSIGSV